jgi:hypothetical protein
MPRIIRKNMHLQISRIWNIKFSILNYLNKLIFHQMSEEDFQGVGLHDRTHTQEVDWMSSKLLPSQHQEIENKIMRHYAKI